jgi:hypothetical protein
LENVEMRTQQTISEGCDKSSRPRWVQRIRGC